MAKYESKCTNHKCEKYKEIISSFMLMSEYSEDKLPVCEKCGTKTKRVYSAVGHQTFGDGYKG